MPKIYEYIGYILFFYSNEHLPIHCHVRKQQREVKAVIEYVDGEPVVRFLKVRYKDILRDKELTEIEEFIIAKHEKIVTKWTEYFVIGKSPRVGRISKKI